MGIFATLKAGEYRKGGNFMERIQITELGAFLAFFADHPFSLTLLCIFLLMLLISLMQSLRRRDADFWETPQEWEEPTPPSAESQEWEEKKEPFDWEEKIPLIWVGIASLSEIVRDFRDDPQVLGWVVGMMAALTVLTFLVERLVRWVHRE